MPDYMLEEHNTIKKAINTQHAFQKLITQNTTQHLEQHNPLQKLAIIEQITNKRIIPNESILQSILKDQQIEEQSKPYITAINKIEDAKAAHAEQLAIEDEKLTTKDLAQKLEVARNTLDTMLQYTTKKQSNEEATLQLLITIANTYLSFNHHNIYNNFDFDDRVKIFAINKTLLNKKLF